MIIKVLSKSSFCDYAKNYPALFGLLLLLSGCQTISSPEQVTMAFWEAMAAGNVEAARQYATRETQYLVTKQEYLEDARVKTGRVLIDGSDASVMTVMSLTITEGNKDLFFDTVLSKEDDLWKIDYQRTLNHLFDLPFGDIFKSLRAIGETINKELERQIPLFEHQIKSFSEELIRQLDEFRRQLEKSIPPEKQKSQSGAI